MRAHVSCRPNVVLHTTAWSPESSAGHITGSCAGTEPQEVLPGPGSTPDAGSASASENAAHILDKQPVTNITRPNLAGEDLSDVSPQMKSNRSNIFETCLSEALWSAVSSLNNIYLQQGGLWRDPMTDKELEITSKTERHQERR